MQASLAIGASPVALVVSPEFVLKGLWDVVNKHRRESVGVSLCAAGQLGIPANPAWVNMRELLTVSWRACHVPLNLAFSPGASRPC